MQGTAAETSTDWAALLDELKEKESYSSDAKLAEALGVTRGYICSVRKGRKNVSLDLATTIFSLLGRTDDISESEHLFIPVRVRKYTVNMAAFRRCAIERAKGLCQLCGEKAPFQGRDGAPYLETHYVVRLSDGGSSSLENLVALCPNCHQKILHCPTPEDLFVLEQLVNEYKLAEN